MKVGDKFQVPKGKGFSFGGVRMQVEKIFPNGQVLCKGQTGREYLMGPEVEQYIESGIKGVQRELGRLLMPA